jgi:hypothetical protein
MGWPKTNFQLANTGTTTAPSTDRATGKVAPEPGRCSCGVALESRLGQACNEEAFRHFLAIERKRSQRSGRTFLLLLVRRKKQRGTIGPIDSAVTAKLFACLWLCLRETDLVGWFREGRVAGALLSQAAGVSGTNVADLVVEKVRRSLHESLPSDFVRCLDVRAFRLPSSRKGLN